MHNLVGEPGMGPGQLSSFTGKDVYCRKTTQRIWQIWTTKYSVIPLANGLMGRPETEGPSLRESKVNFQTRLYVFEKIIPLTNWQTDPLINWKT